MICCHLSLLVIEFPHHFHHHFFLLSFMLSMSVIFEMSPDFANSASEARSVSSEDSSLAATVPFSDILLHKFALVSRSTFSSGRILSSLIFSLESNDSLDSLELVIDIEVSSPNSTSFETSYLNSSEDTFFIISQSAAKFSHSTKSLYSSAATFS